MQRLRGVVVVKRTCSISDCARPAYSRGWCQAHYTRWRRYGDPLGGGPERRSHLEPAERFWSYVDRNGDGCWLWRGYVAQDGYGRANFSQLSPSPLMAHRVSYQLTLGVGSIPEGLQLDHLCRVRNCVNPAHLEPVTGWVNTMRGQTPAARFAARSVCAQGHAFDAANTRIRRDGSRACRACHRQYQQEYLRRKAGAP
jgi:hypothetical protein